MVISGESSIVFSLHLPPAGSLAVSADSFVSAYCTESVNLSQVTEDAALSLHLPVSPDSSLDNCDIIYHVHFYLHPLSNHF